VLLSSNWLEWYHFRHQQECFKSGTPFEDYVSNVLRRHHEDFVNPTPAGQLGDGGNDGLADGGKVLYACYGQRPGRNAERETNAKFRSDFERGRDQWKTFTEWRFVTNAPIGPETTKSYAELQQHHAEGTARPLRLRIWPPDALWDNVVGKLSIDVLNEIFPGAPGVANLELADLLPLLDNLGQADNGTEAAATILPVPPSKMEFNNLPDASRAEFNSGRPMAPRIDKWYAEGSDPGLSDAHGDRFKGIYLAARAVTAEPADVLERIYVAVAGENFRMDGKRANAAYAVVAYFFDSCHIFEMPPGDHEGSDAAAN
jgi:hypothetical protein